MKRGLLLLALAIPRFLQKERLGEAQAYSPGSAGSDGPGPQRRSSASRNAARC